MQKWNTPPERPQSADEKNWVICLVIMFTLTVIIIKMSQMAHICIFCDWQQQISYSLGKILKGLSGFFQKMVYLIGFEVTVNIEGRN